MPSTAAAATASSLPGFHSHTDMPKSRSAVGNMEILGIIQRGEVVGMGFLAQGTNWTPGILNVLGTAWYQTSPVGCAHGEDSGKLPWETTVFKIRHFPRVLCPPVQMSTCPSSVSLWLSSPQVLKSSPFSLLPMVPSVNHSFPFPSLA